MTKDRRLKPAHAPSPSVVDADAALDRIRCLEERLARTAPRSAARRVLSEAVLVEASLYREHLDALRAAATRTKRSERHRHVI